MNSEIWTEKYRPRKLIEMQGQKEITDRLASFIKEKNIPHLLFAGPAGVGKTTAVLCIARELFGEDIKNNFLELNASDERGIDVVRNNIKNFARTGIIGNYPFKIIVLDEADALTTEAQQALRRTMEKYTRTCRFILDCNYSSKIIDPIQSRCAVFRFRPLDNNNLKEYIKNIAKNENINIEEKAVESLCIICRGDARKSTNIMQSCSILNKKITEEEIFKISGYAKPDELKEAVLTAISGDFKKSKSMVLDIMINYGLSGLDIIRQISSIVFELDISPESKMKMADKIGEIEFRMVEGADETIQLEALISQFCLQK